MSERKDKPELTPKAALAELESHAWALRPDVLGSLVSMAQNGRLVEAIVDATDVEAARSGGRPTAIKGGIARISVKGVLAPVGGLLAMLFDIPDPLETFKSRLLEALGNEDVGAVLLDFDSPGGVVSNIPETAQVIKEARGDKPIIAHANGQMASAAYWLGSQADEIIVTPSGSLGSIGVYATHQDLTGMAEKDGVKITIVSAGKYKAETHPFKPLTEEAQAHLQEDADTYYDMFTSDVAEGRAAATGTKISAQDVKDGYGEGRSLTAKAAVAAGLADRVESIGGTIARLASRQRGSLSAEDLTGAGIQAGEAEAELEAEAPAGAGDGDERTPEEERKLLHDVLIG